eukprot:678961-Rhodomonas_salina.1
MSSIRFSCRCPFSTAHCPCPYNTRTSVLQSCWYNTRISVLQSCCAPQSRYCNPAGTTLAS